MKHILLAILILAVFKGLTYLFFPQGIKFLAQKMADIDDLQYKIFGLLLLFCCFVFWVGYLRHYF